MPPSSEQSAGNPEPPLNIGPFQKEGAHRKGSPSRKGQAKAWKKHESSGENMEKEQTAKASPKDVTSPSSILSQLQKSTSPPAAPQSISSNLLEAWDPALPSAQSSETNKKTATDWAKAWDPALPTQNTETPKQTTTEWSRTIPYGSSPPNTRSIGASIAGSTPPNQPQLDRFQGGFSHTSPPTSPRSAYRQPVQRNTEYQGFGGYLGSSPNSRRPNSAYSQYSHYPPPPHHPQAHFYGAPDIDFGMSGPASKQRSSVYGLCNAFDSLQSTGQDGRVRTENVLLVGFERGLSVHRVDKKHFEPIGRLEGLRGSVLGAKILPSQPSGGRLDAIRPLVALVVHGPYMASGGPVRSGARDVDDDEFDPSNSMMQVLETADTKSYQTTVEIYSLRKGDHVATLFLSPMVPMEGGRNGVQSDLPPSKANLSIQAAGKFIMVTSGTSGEVFVFENVPRDEADPTSDFKCIGKVWTRTVSKKTRRDSISSRDSGPKSIHDEKPSTLDRTEDPIASLSARWLAVVPPPSSSQTSLYGSIAEGPSYRIPGLASHTSLAEPQTTCDLDTPEVESLLNKMARDATQELMKSARWVGTQGMQAWSKYWAKGPEQGHVGSPPHSTSMPQPQVQNAFPPTHAQENLASRVRNQPTLVSILDLERLSHNQHSKEAVALQPLATFSLPYGCSLVSFSPNGLNLLTTSAKGDVQQIWDLMRSIHGETGRAGDQDTAQKGPSVREVARFTRITEARVVDIVWTKPRGERLAIVTDNGTVHIYELPASASQWPPPRRTKRIATAPPVTAIDSRENETTSSEPAASSVSSAFGMLTGKAQPFMAAVRGRTASAGSALSGFGGLASTAGAGAKGGKAVAAGINRSFSAAASETVNTIRHLGENRISLPTSSKSISPGCVQWLSGKNEGLLAVTGAGLVRIHGIRQSSNPKAVKRRPSVLGGRPIEFSIPQSSPLRQSRSGPQSEAPTPASSYWLPPSSRPVSRNASRDIHPLSYAEIETHAPYQPFHTDRRVNFYIYSPDPSDADPHHLHSSNEPWVFGNDIPATRISSGTAAHTDDEDISDNPAPGAMENVVSMQDDEEEGPTLVVTTRKKKGRKEPGEVREFFEDDFAIVDFAEDRV